MGVKLLLLFDIWLFYWKIQEIQETVIFPSKNAKMTNIQRFTVSIQSMVKPSVFYPASRTQPNSSLKVSELTSTPPMSWWTAMFLTEKTEENGHLEQFYGNVCLRKVLQNDLICYPGYKETPSGHSSVVIDRDPPFLRAKTPLLRQFIEIKSVSNHHQDSLTPSGQPSIIIDCDPWFLTHFGVKLWKLRLSPKGYQLILIYVIKVQRIFRPLRWKDTLGQSVQTIYNGSHKFSRKNSPIPGSSQWLLVVLFSSVRAFYALMTTKRKALILFTVQ